ncbi:uncharacterized protein BDV14DRAFT_102514 [Aspergillus stella-maris]|uniref:uncharacterized protein n=1 Tax=Aspergillus stella-maris TaxID=1810926 RepID=UPI003CCCA55F
MVLLRSVLAIVSLASIAKAQDNSTVDASSVNDRTKQQWCISQTSSCPLICLQLPGTTDQPMSNDCDDDTLVYSCICSNGQTPNASEYSQTIPYYLCTEQNNRCVDACAQIDSSCQSNCRTDNPCGAQNPRPPNNTANGNATSTGTATTSTSSLPPFTGLPQDDDEGAAGRAGVDMRSVYGMVLGLGGFLAGFTILL